MGNLASNWENQSSTLMSAQAPWTAKDLDGLARELLVRLSATGIAIAREDARDPGTLVCVVSLGTCVPPRGAHVDPNSGISGRCIREGRTQQSYDTCLDPRVERTAIERLGIRSLVAVPIFAGPCCVGLLEVVSDRPGHFDGDKVALVESAAESASELLHRQQQSSQVLVRDSSRLPFATEALRPSDSPALSNGTTEAPQSELPDHSARRDATAVPESSRRHADLGRNFVSWWLVGAVLIAVVAASYVLYRQTNSQRTTHQKTTVSSTSAMPPASAATANQNTATMLPPRAAANGAGSSSLLERASRGVISDQISLANAYLKGDGVQRDPEKAASWYIIAGENGSARAKRRSVEATRGMSPFQIGQIRFDVGKMFMHGIGTPRDNIAAYTWFELAKAAGEVRAEGEEQILKTTMQPAQVKEGKRRASAWLQSHSRKRAALR